MYIDIAIKMYFIVAHKNIGHTVFRKQLKHSKHLTKRWAIRHCAACMHMHMHTEYQPHALLPIS